MLNSIITEISEVLQKGLQDKVDKRNILTIRKVDLSESSSLPKVAVYDAGFKFEEIGLNGSLGDAREEVAERFDGDGKRTIFQLHDKPVRPLLDVEEGSAKKNEIDDYKVNYDSGAIKFRSPPTKGEKNVIVRYMLPRATGEIKGLRLSIDCRIDIWAVDQKNCDDITIDVMKTLLLSKENLSSKGIRVIPVNGAAIEDGSSSNNVHGRRLTYTLETDLQVRIDGSIIKKIHISGEK